MVQWITDYKTATAVLAHKNFEEMTFKGLVPLLGHVIVTLENDVHRARRGLEGRLFVTSLLKSYEQTVIPNIINEALEPLRQNKKGCLVQISQNVTSRIAAKLIGIDKLENPTLVSEAVHLLSALVSGTQAQHPDHPVLTRQQARNQLRERFILPAINKRQNYVADYKVGKISREDLPLDLITLLLLHDWQVKQIIGEVAFYAVAGVDTTATLIPHLMHELWRFIALRPYYAEEVHKLEFLRLATAEALRLHPVLPTLFRKAVQKIEIEDYVFEEKETAGIYLTRANRDKMIFGQSAEQFNPLRDVPPNVRRAGLSFGGGAHLCLGRELATGRTLVGEGEAVEENQELFGEAALLAQALFQLNTRPNPTHQFIPPTEFERDVYHTYPIILD